MSDRSGQRNRQTECQRQAKKSDTVISDRGRYRDDRGRAVQTKGQGQIGRYTERQGGRNTDTQSQRDRDRESDRETKTVRLMIDSQRQGDRRRSERLT